MEPGPVRRCGWRRSSPAARSATRIALSLADTLRCWKLRPPQQSNAAQAFAVSTVAHMPHIRGLSNLPACRLVPCAQARARSRIARLFFNPPWLMSSRFLRNVENREKLATADRTVARVGSSHARGGIRSCAQVSDRNPLPLSQSRFRKLANVYMQAHCFTRMYSASRAKGLVALRWALGVRRTTRLRHSNLQSPLCIHHASRRRWRHASSNRTASGLRAPCG
jgi:hypothetical protein